MNVAVRSLILVLPMLLAGCSFFNTSSQYKNRDTTYMSAKSIPPIKIPPGLSSSSIHNEYPVTARTYSKSEMDVSLAPPGLVQGE